jgi:dCMP deaminase
MKHKFITAYMNVAEEFAKLSSARRLHVGCVIVKNDSIIGVGYNGTPTGWDNNCEDEVYDRETNRDLLVTKPEVLHAETNAIAKVAKSTNSTEGASMFITHAPCLDCSKIIAQTGIAKVFYKNIYRNSDGLEFLRKSNVECINTKGD